MPMIPRVACATTAAALTAPVHSDADHRMRRRALGPPAESGHWSSVAPLPEPRSEVASADPRRQGCYVAGGFGDPRGQVLDAFAVYDPATDAWTELAKLPESRHHGR